MSEESREARRTRRLREILPLYGFIELQVERLEPGAVCSVPMTASNANHVGIMHAGVLFALAEATGGLAVAEHKDLARFAVIAKEVKIAYRRPAKSRIRAEARLAEPEAQAVRAGMAESPNHPFIVPVRLVDEDERCVAEAECVFVLRSAGP